jgi:hypothetical protein
MKISKRQLRETIREILLENTADYDKIVTLLVEGTLDSIKQGIELAEAMGYAHNVEYKTTPIRTTYHNEVDRMVHVWSISVPQDFHDIILNKWDTAPKSAIPYTKIYPKSGDSIGIKVQERVK